MGDTAEELGGGAHILGDGAHIKRPGPGFEADKQIHHAGERRRKHTLTDIPQPGPEETLSAQEVQNALRRAVAALPEDFRDVVILHVYGGISLREISAMKGKSDSWGKVTYYRAKQMLRKELEGLR